MDNISKKPIIVIITSRVWHPILDIQFAAPVFYHTHWSGELLEGGMWGVYSASFRRKIFFSAR